MKRNVMPASAWVVDYSAARAHAIRWLGERYLLARPINASRYVSRPLTPDVLSPASNADRTS